MTKEEINELGFDELDTRAAEIAEETRTADVEGIEKLNGELDLIEQRRRELQQEVENRKQAVDKVIEGEGKVVEEVKEDRKMTRDEIRNSKAYIDAYANYIKTGKDEECRTLLTTENDSTPNGTAKIAVPEFVLDVIRTAWQRDGIMSRVRKEYFKGNLKVNFEASGDDAVVHAEGAAAISPEDLTIGLVELKPEYIKKVLPITKEIASMRGEAFLRYVYDELAYRIVKKAAKELLAKINAASTTASSTAVGVPKVTSTTISVSLVAQAMALLSAEAEDPVVIINRATWGEFKKVQAANGYNYDPFEGLPVVFTNDLTAFSAATTGVTYAIVGDLGRGALANYPNGDEIEYTYDEFTRKKENIIEILGEQYVGLGLVGPDCFVKITH